MNKYCQIIPPASRKLDELLNHFMINPMSVKMVIASYQSTDEFDSWFIQEWAYINPVPNKIYHFCITIHIDKDDGNTYHQFIVDWANKLCLGYRSFEDTERGKVNVTPIITEPPYFYLTQYLTSDIAFVPLILNEQDQYLSAILPTADVPVRQPAIRQFYIGPAPRPLTPSVV